MKKGTNYCAYPFLYDDPEDLKCDYEIFTDEISSTIGLLRAFINQDRLRDELSKIADLVYHMNSSLRTKTGVYESELQWLNERCAIYKEETKNNYTRFVLPQGSIAAAQSHIIRTKFKALVRMLHRYEEKGNKVDPLLYDFANILSQYFFLLALKLNSLENIKELEYISRSY